MEHTFRAQEVGAGGIRGQDVWEPRHAANAVARHPWMPVSEKKMVKMQSLPGGSPTSLEASFFCVYCRLSFKLEAVRRYLMVVAGSSPFGSCTRSLLPGYRCLRSQHGKELDGRGASPSSCADFPLTPQFSEQPFSLPDLCPEARTLLVQISRIISSRGQEGIDASRHLPTLLPLGGIWGGRFSLHKLPRFLTSTPCPAPQSSGHLLCPPPEL